MDADLSLAFFLAAGLGTRLRPWTESRPKPALPFLNLPLTAYGFYLAQQAGFKDYLFNLHHLPKIMEQTARGFSSHCHSVQFSDESEKILGSGGALDKARQTLAKSSAFLIANADEILFDKRQPIKLLQQEFNEHQPLACLLTCDHPDLLTVFNAVWVKNGYVRGFGKVAPEPGCQPVHYTGYKMFSPRVLERIPAGESNIFYEILTQAIQEGEAVRVCHLASTNWYETGNFASFVEASIKIASEQRELLNEVHHFFGQKLIFLNGKTKDDLLICHPEQESLAKDLNWSGIVCLGKNVLIPTTTRLHNVIASDNSQVPDQELLQDSFVF